MQTEIVPISEGIKNCVELQRRVQLREMDADTFITRHSSGTLRKNRAIGMAWQQQYLEERTAYEFGWEFECLPRSRVTFGVANTEGDASAITEAGWHIERYLTLAIFPEDQMETKYIMIEESDGKRREGIGIIVRQTSAQFVPKGHLVFAIITPLDPVTHTWMHANNPF
jgi:hypothetical protein